MSNGQIIVTDMAQGVDCWMCEEGEPHAHGQILTPQQDVDAREHTCPVCEYGRLTHPPRDYMICPQCGTEFGNDDTLYTHAELRAAWEAKGRPWFSRETQDR